MLSLSWPNLAITIALRVWDGRRRLPAVVDHVRVKSNELTLDIHRINHMWIGRSDKKGIYFVK